MKEQTFFGVSALAVGAIIYTTSTDNTKYFGLLFAALGVVILLG